MTHEQVRAVLAGDAPDNPEVAMHLATCADCRAYADGLAAVDALARTLPAIPVPQDLIELTTVAMDREIHPRVRRRRAVWVGAAFALAAALLLFFRGPPNEGVGRTRRVRARRRHAACTTHPLEALPYQWPKSLSRASTIVAITIIGTTNSHENNRLSNLRCM